MEIIGRAFMVIFACFAAVGLFCFMLGFILTVHVQAIEQAATYLFN